MHAFTRIQSCEVAVKHVYDQVDRAKRIMGYREGTCPPEVEAWIEARLREMSFWDMIDVGYKFWHRSRKTLF